MIEIVDNWLSRYYPKTPTWKEIADVVEQLEYTELANSLRHVYVTGMAITGKIVVVCINIETTV